LGIILSIKIGKVTHNLARAAADENGGISLHLLWTSFRFGSDFVYQKRRIEFSNSSSELIGVSVNNCCLFMSQTGFSLNRKKAAPASRKISLG